MGVGVVRVLRYLPFMVLGYPLSVVFSLWKLHGNTIFYEWILFTIPSLFIGLFLIYYFYTNSMEDEHKKLMLAVWTGYVLLTSSNLEIFHHYFSSFAFRGIFFYLHICVLIQMCMLSTCQLRSFLYRVLVSLPCTFFFSANVFVGFYHPILAILFYAKYTKVAFSICFIQVAFAFAGLFQTVEEVEAHDAWEEIHLNYDIKNNKKISKIRRLPYLKSKYIVESEKVLRIVQITDPHIGPVMPPERLRRICEHIVKIDPDLVLLTGDYLTAEAHGPPTDSLKFALEPLSSISSKCFACLGNHDKERNAIHIVKRDLRELGISLLVDEATTFRKGDLEIQIIGMNFYATNKHINVPSVCKKFPRKVDTLRLILLHDPAGFFYVPEDDHSFVFSGHTHGGQVGLLSLGFNLTMVGLVGLLDHGFWGLNTNKLYIHKGQGTRMMLGSMLVRSAVPPEHSVLHIHYDI